jgi:cysteinyl-tRNA synthetase
VTLRLYNTLTRTKEPFQPIDPSNVRMYVCGPTVYDFAHIGNARPVIVFDVLFRLLRHIYGAEHVTYARNITDVDDKINARAAEEYPDLPLNEAIAKVTGKTTKQFHEDIAALGVLPPTVEPRATEHIAEMRTLCEALVAKGHAYVAQEHVLFDVGSMADYGRLANRSLEEMEAGARVDVAPYKQGPMDFVLWKPSKPGEPAWPSPAGIATPGRPGWHIECSAMADRWLWQEPKMKGLLSEAGLKQPHVFDIHGGGIDLVFPHHENEIAQSRCGHGTPAMANVWMHNGFLQVEGEKMSKSLGNFVTIRDALGQAPNDTRWGEVLRLNMLKTHYRQPLDWTQSSLNEALITYGAFRQAVTLAHREGARPSPAVIAALEDDLNTPAVLAELHKLARRSRSGNMPADAAQELVGSLMLLGFERAIDHVPVEDSVRKDVTRSFHEVSAREMGLDPKRLDALRDARGVARKARDFKEADRIRDELIAMGIQLKDAKNPATGEIETTWEVKR